MPAGDPVSDRQKQLKLSQKITEAIANYCNNSDYERGVQPDQFKEVYNTLKQEQSTLQEEISNLMC